MLKPFLSILTLLKNLTLSMYKINYSRNFCLPWKTIWFWTRCIFHVKRIKNHFSGRRQLSPFIGVGCGIEKYSNMCKTRILIGFYAKMTFFEIEHRKGTAVPMISKACNKNWKIFRAENMKDAIIHSYISNFYHIWTFKQLFQFYWISTFVPKTFTYTFQNMLHT